MILSKRPAFITFLFFLSSLILNHIWGLENRVEPTFHGVYTVGRVIDSKQQNKLEYQKKNENCHLGP